MGIVIMVFFPNEVVELWEYTENSEVPNFFGETTTDYEYEGSYPCDFQPMSSKDMLNEYGKILQDTYKIYLDIDVPITDTMLLRLEGKTDTYYIQGSPQVNNHNIISHIKVLVTKQRQPTELISNTEDTEEGG